MAGGSHSPESPRDQQCRHCGRWFSDRGIKAHESNCEFEQWDVVLVELEDPDDVGGTPPVEGSVPTEPEPADGEAGNPTTHGSDPSDAVTDGGEGLGLSGPPSTPEPEEDPTDDPEPERETEDCPRCGSDLEATEEEIAAAENPQCSECGCKLRVVDE